MNHRSFILVTDSPFKARCPIPIYVYKHPETEEEFEVIRSYEEADKPYKSPDGKKCKRVLYPQNGIGGVRVVDKNAEVWEKDPSYVKKLNPKYVRRRDGVKERYDPTRHC
jgi:hypothetical protein